MTHSAHVMQSDHTEKTMRLQCRRIFAEKWRKIKRKNEMKYKKIVLSHLAMYSHHTANIMSLFSFCIFLFKNFFERFFLRLFFFLSPYLLSRFVVFFILFFHEKVMKMEAKSFYRQYSILHSRIFHVYHNLFSARLETELLQIHGWFRIYGRLSFQLKSPHNSCLFMFFSFCILLQSFASAQHWMILLFLCAFRV